jgi:PHD/YefM family antitoxin component YafN of YafNO toxin-antitoxin module
MRWEVENTVMNQDKLQYITDDRGEKTAVILPLSEFEELMEDLEDLAIVAERRDEPTLSHPQLLSDLEKNGLIHH